MPSPELFKAVGDLMEEATKAGVLLGGEGLTPTSHCKRVKVMDGKVMVTDGPFTESKELIASYALLQVETWDEAVYWTRRFLETLGGGECELRPIFEASDFPPEVFSSEEAAREVAVRERMQQNALGG